MSRHHRRHRGHLRLIGSWHHGRHAARAARVAGTFGDHRKSLVLAAPAPGLDVRPIHARPRGPHPYDPWPATAPMTAIPAHLAELAIEPAIERRVA